MICEESIGKNGYSGVAVAERGDVSTITTVIKYPNPYFDPRIDWQAGAENPNKAIIEERNREKLVQKSNTMVVRDMYTLMSHIARVSPEGVESIVLRARSGIFQTGGQLETFNPGEMMTEKYAIKYAYTLRQRMFSMLEKQNTDLPNRALAIASTISNSLTEKYKVEVTANSGVQRIKM